MPGPDGFDVSSRCILYMKFYNKNNIRAKRSHYEHDCYVSSLL
jgi:hypothetical protein